jgi:hypothetical protein
VFDEADWPRDRPYLQGDRLRVDEVLVAVYKVSGIQFEEEDLKYARKVYVPPEKLYTLSSTIGMKITKEPYAVVEVQCQTSFKRMFLAQLRQRFAVLFSSFLALFLVALLSLGFRDFGSFPEIAFKATGLERISRIPLVVLSLDRAVTVYRTPPPTIGSFGFAALCIVILVYVSVQIFDAWSDADDELVELRFCPHFIDSISVALDREGHGVNQDTLVGRVKAESMRLSNMPFQDLIGKSIILPSRAIAEIHVMSSNFTTALLSLPGGGVGLHQPRTRYLSRG